MDTRDATEIGSPSAPHARVTLPPVKLLLTVEEACAALGVKRTVLYSLFKGHPQSRRLVSVKVGSRRLIPMSSLQAFVASLCEEVA